MIPYGRHEITEADRQAVLDALDSGWLTGGPTSRAFEADLGRVCGAPEVVGCVNGTAALHLVADAIAAPPGSWWICPPSTFVATIQAGIYAGYRPVFADVDPKTGLLCPDSVQQLLHAARDHGAVVDVSGGFHHRLGLRVDEHIVEDILRPLEHHGGPRRIVLADTDVEGADAHLSEHRLLLRGVHVIAVLLEAVAEPEIQNSGLGHGCEPRIRG